MIQQYYEENQSFLEIYVILQERINMILKVNKRDYY
jgi:hypothetical protein